MSTRGHAPLQRTSNEGQTTNSEGAESLPEPDVLAREIADDLQAAMEQFQANSE
jgi:hypothetical protein